MRIGNVSSSSSRGRTCASRSWRSASTPDEAARRVQGLSDAEIAKIVDQMDEEPAGQGIVVALVATILIIFLVLIITDLLGVTNVFPFIDPLGTK